MDNGLAEPQKKPFERCIQSTQAQSAVDEHLQCIIMRFLWLCSAFTVYMNVFTLAFGYGTPAVLQRHSTV